MDWKMENIYRENACEIYNYCLKPRHVCVCVCGAQCAMCVFFLVCNHKSAHLTLFILTKSYKLHEKACVVTQIGRRRDKFFFYLFDVFGHNVCVNDDIVSWRNFVANIYI